uniref:BAG domain-containing protein n=1 Tax=Heterorhabditis bacteriophora TaxID=37862 RepID=A0A1I7XTR9_HETBA
MFIKSGYQAPPAYAFNNRPNAVTWMALEKRQLEYLQAMRQWRLKRIQQAAIEQQLMKESMARSAWTQQHQQALAEAQMERAQMIRMEQARMARQRMAEEYQAEIERAQMIQAQMARIQMAQAQMAQAQQWWQPQVQWWPRQQQNFPQQQYWPQQQQYYQNQIYPNQQQSHFTFFRTFPRIIPNEQPMMQNGQIPMRPHDASPQQILNNLQQQPIEQSVVPPAPTPAIHDRIYQEMQKKSQGMEFNAPSRPIWTAITPTQDTPVAPYDQDAIFQENLKKALNQRDETTTPSSTEIFPNNEPKEQKVEQPQQEGENVFHDILSAFDQEEKSTTTENVFKAFETEEDKKQSTQFPESTTENIFRAFEDDKEKVKDELVPEDDEETATEPVVIEDRFPRIEERTTTPEPEIVSTKASNESASTESDDIVDPLAAFLRLTLKTSFEVQILKILLVIFLDLRYFEQEAQKMTDNKQEAKPVVVNKATQKTQTDPEAEVDVPEPHFQPISELPKPNIV